MKYVADIVAKSGTINLMTKSKVAHIANLLIAAQNISLDEEKDYLEEIISQPAVSTFLSEFRKSGQLKQLQEIGEHKKQKGKVVDGRTHRETPGQLQRRIANGVIRDDPNAVAKARHVIHNSRSSKGSVRSERLAMLFCAVARTEGKTASYEIDKNERYVITTGEIITR